LQDNVGTIEESTPHGRTWTIPVFKRDASDIYVW